jgi:hypothetical protein
LFDPPVEEPPETPVPPPTAEPDETPLLPSSPVVDPSFVLLEERLSDFFFFVVLSAVDEELCF